MCIGKMGYHKPRPFMVDDDVQVFGCSSEFGHPSGHSYATAALFLMMALEYFNTHKDAATWKKVMVPLSSVLGTLLVGFSRLYNGVHTLDQIILGWLFGVW